MRRRFVCLAAIIVIVLTYTMTGFAAEYEYTLSNLSVTSASVSIDVENKSDAEKSATVYIAIYDEYRTLMAVRSQKVELEQGESKTVTKEIASNGAVTIKSFVWKRFFVPCSEYKYKTTLNEQNIEFGGNV